MTNTQKLTIRASEIRQRLNEISGLEDSALTDEIRAESDTLQTEYRDTETKLRAAVAAEGDPGETRTVRVPEDAEARERRESRRCSTARLPATSGSKCRPWEPASRATRSCRLR